MPNPGKNNRSRFSKTIFRQTFRFAKNVPEQRISPEGFLVRDCGCVMRFLPNPDNKSGKTTPAVAKNLENLKYDSRAHLQRKDLNETTTILTEMKTVRKFGKHSDVETVDFKAPRNIQQTALYQSTFWMEPRVVPVKYTTEVNFNLESPTKRFTETIYLEMKLVPCPYIHKIGTTTHFKTSIETRIQSEYTLPLNTTT